MAKRPSSARGGTNTTFGNEQSGSENVGIFDDLINTRFVTNGERINENTANRAILDLIKKNLGDAALVHRVRNNTDTQYIGDVLTLGWLGNGSTQVVTTNLNNIIDKSGHWRWNAGATGSPTPQEGTCIQSGKLCIAYSESSIYYRYNTDRWYKVYTDFGEIGTIKSGPYKNAPPGWLFLDGTVYNRTNYPDLWNYINTNFTTVSDGNRGANPGAFTTGNGTTTFRVPNMAGLFVRGQGGQSQGIGQLQDTALIKHRHVYQDTAKNANWTYNGWADADAKTYWKAQSTAQTKNSGSAGWFATGNPISSTQQSTTQLDKPNLNDSETRPINVAWKYIIKAV